MREWKDAFLPAFAAWRRSGVAAFPLTCIGLIGVTVLAGANFTVIGHHILRTWVDEYGTMPARASAIRLIPSMFAPASRLPAWAAFAQIAIIISAAEAMYGSRTVAVVAILTHVVATVSARFFFWIGPHAFLGLSRQVAHFADAGPSAATLGVAAFVVMASRGRQTMGALFLFFVGEEFVHPGLAQREHIVAASLGLAMGYAYRSRHVPVERELAAAHQ